jgi:hypothetical protein
LKRRTLSRRPRGREADGAEAAAAFIEGKTISTDHTIERLRARAEAAIKNRDAICGLLEEGQNGGYVSLETLRFFLHIAAEGADQRKGLCGLYGPGAVPAFCAVRP